MVGMGPYIPAPGTPMGRFQVSGFRFQGTGENLKHETCNLELSLRMIALTRLYLHDVNIVAATALEALDPEGGRNRGVEAGANVVMPVLTPETYRKCYDLYPGKATALSSKLESTGETP